MKIKKILLFVVSSKIILLFLLLICSCTKEYLPKKNIHYVINTEDDYVKIIPFYVYNNNYKSLYYNYIFGINILKVYVDGKEIKKESCLIKFDEYASLQFDLNLDTDYIYNVDVFDNGSIMEGLLVTDVDGIPYQFNITRNITNLKIIYKISLPDGKYSDENIIEINYDVLQTLHNRY